MYESLVTKYETIYIQRFHKKKNINLPFHKVLANILQQNPSNMGFTAL